MIVKKSISGREFKLTCDKNKRHYTIRTNGFVYRTFKMSKEEFNSAYNNTGNDWAQFMTTNEYYKVK